MKKPVRCGCYGATEYGVRSNTVHVCQAEVVSALTTGIWMPMKSNHRRLPSRCFLFELHQCGHPPHPPSHPRAKEMAKRILGMRGDEKPIAIQARPPCWVACLVFRGVRPTRKCTMTYPQSACVSFALHHIFLFHICHWGVRPSSKFLSHSF
jgi:hypothetical protein